MREKIVIRDLLVYESPSIAEWVSINWMQEAIGWFLARRIESKIKRYNRRKTMMKVFGKE